MKLIKFLFIWIVLSLVSTLAHAHNIECGDTLGPGGSFKLKKDLDCNITPALTLLGGVKLRLGGNSIRCDINTPGVSIGILLEGERNSVTDGTVLFCDEGVSLRGKGRHVVRDVHYDAETPGEVIGFHVESNHNRLSRNSAIGCGECVIISGNRNTLDRNTILDSPGLAFIVRGKRNRLLRNTVDDAFFRAFEISGGGNILIRNEATGANDAAFAVEGDNNKIIRNTASENMIGFKILGNANNVTRNEAEDNEKSGIQVAGTNNKMRRNTALENGDGVSGFDLEDEHPDCDNNIWRRNTFDTRNVDCIR